MVNGGMRGQLSIIAVDECSHRLLAIGPQIIHNRLKHGHQIVWPLAHFNVEPPSGGWRALYVGTLHVEPILKLAQHVVGHDRRHN